MSFKNNWLLQQHLALKSIQWQLPSDEVAIAKTELICRDIWRTVVHRKSSSHLYRPIPCSTTSWSTDMASIVNRSHYQVSVKNRDDLTNTFPPRQAGKSGSLSPVPAGAKTQTQAAPLGYRPRFLSSEPDTRTSSAQIGRLCCGAVLSVLSLDRATASIWNAAWKFRMACAT